MLPTGMPQEAPTPYTQQAIQPGMVASPPSIGMTQDQMLQMYDVLSPSTQPILMPPGSASSVVFGIPGQPALPAEPERVIGRPLFKYKNVRIGTKETFRRR